MKARLPLHLASAVLVACVATACSDQSPGATGDVDVTMQQTDAFLAQVVSGWYASVVSGDGSMKALDPDMVEALTVSVTSIQFLPGGSDEADDAGWVELELGEPLLLDLMALPTEGEWPLVIGSGTVEAGTYSKVRLFTGHASIRFKGPISLGNAVTFDGGVDHPVDIPSGDETGIKTDASLTVEADANGNVNSVHLLFSSGSTFRNVTATGNKRVILAPVIRAAPVTVVPLRITFVSDRDGNQEIYVMNADGSGLTNLTNNPATDNAYQWSPDGTQIAFVAYRDGNSEVYVMNSDGSGQTNLSNHPQGDFSPSWSPDGSKIAFHSWRVPSHSNIFVMNPDGSGLFNLTNTPYPATEGHPRWSPDGSKIAFQRTDGNEEIYVINADGSGLTNLTNNPAADGDHRWSPDGTQIAFVSYRDGNSEVYVMNSDGSGQTNLSNHPEGDYSPSWSPDGSKIAFHSWRVPSQSNIFVMNPDGSGLLNLTNGTAGIAGHPRWSLYGSRIAFEGNGEIYAMRADGSGLTNLTDNPAQDGDPWWWPYR